MGIEGESKYIPESAEKESPGLKIDFVRHGETLYTGKYPDILAEGKDKIRESAKKIVEGIDRDHEIVVIWQSPAQRTKDTAGVIVEELEEAGIQVFRQSNIPALRDRLKSYEQAQNLHETFTEENNEIFSEIPFEEWATLMQLEVAEPGTPPEGHADVARRFRNILYHMYGAMENMQMETGKRLHFIVVSHNTSINEIFIRTGLVESGIPELERGGLCTLELGKNHKISIDYNGQKFELPFDRDKREFVQDKEIKYIR